MTKLNMCDWLPFITHLNRSLPMATLQKSQTVGLFVKCFLFPSANFFEGQILRTGRHHNVRLSSLASCLTPQAHISELHPAPSKGCSITRWCQIWKTYYPSEFAPSKRSLGRTMLPWFGGMRLDLKSLLNIYCPVKLAISPDFYIKELEASSFLNRDPRPAKN